MKQTWIVLLAFALVLGVAGCVREKGPPSTGKGTTAAPPAAEQFPGKDELIDVDVPPQLLNRVIPKYPESARAKGIEGVVYVKALVGTDGIVRTAEIMKNEGGVPELGQSALEAAQASSFAPAKKDGKAVAVWVTIPFRFALQKSGGEKLLSELKHPKDPVYVEGYLEGLRDGERQLQGNLDALRAQDADTKEVEQTLQRLKTKISALQAHLDKLKAEKPVR